MRQTGRSGPAADQEMLLREADHRGKNSLQLVSSMLRLQAMQHASVPLLKEELLRASHRVEAIARAHECLHWTQSTGEIDFADYLGSLCTDLAAFLPASAIEFDAAVPAPMPAGTAIPLGLIAAELITNACKHGCRDGATVRLHIGLAALGEDMLRLSVDDDGTGLPDSFDPTRSSGLGMQIVTTLVCALGARLETKRKKTGASFALLLPRLPAQGGPENTAPQERKKSCESPRLPR